MPSLVPRDERERARRERVPRPERMTRLTVWLPPDQMAALHALATRQGRTDTSLVREAVARLLRLEEREAPATGSPPLPMRQDG